MYYDIVFNNMNMNDTKKAIKIENDLNKRVVLIVELIKRKYRDYVETFGITGSMARGEGTIKFYGTNIVGSDIDFGIVTKYISPLKEKEIKRGISKIFSGSKIEPGYIFFSPTILKKPDLMFYEFVNSGRVLYGNLNFAYKADKIPLWEAVRLMTLRAGGPFLKEFEIYRGDVKTSKKFGYALSRAILGCGEALLIAERKYRPSMKEREKQIRKNMLAKKIPRFYVYYEDAMNYRRGLDSFGKDSKRNVREASIIILDTWKAILDKMFRGEYKKNKAALKRISAPFPTILTTRIFYAIKCLKKGKIKIPISEPFGKECITIIDFLESFILKDMAKAEQSRREAVELWEASELFWVPDRNCKITRCD